MTYRALYAYPWDVAEVDPPELGADLSVLGLDTLSLAAAYHAGKFLRPHGVGARVYFPEDGTVYFRARPERYGRLQPLINSAIRERDVLAELLAAGIRVNAWTVALHNSRLGQLHPEAVVRNAFGDPYIYSLCPANPEVRRYVVALVADLADAYPIAGVTLETIGFLPYRHGYHHEFEQVRLNPWLEALLGLCFCDHCVAQAGRTAERLKQRVAAAIDSYLAGAAEAPADMAGDWLAGDLVGDAELAAFLAWRCGVVTSLVAEIRAALRRDVPLAVIPTVARPTARAWVEGAALKELAQVADALELALYEPSTERALADFWDVRRRVGREAKLRCILRPGPPDCASQSQLIATIDGLAAAGVTDFAFYNYGHLRQTNLDWIRGALVR